MEFGNHRASNLATHKPSYFFYDLFIQTVGRIPPHAAPRRHAPPRAATGAAPRPGRPTATKKCRKRDGKRAAAEKRLWRRQSGEAPADAIPPRCIMRRCRTALHPRICAPTFSSLAADRATADTRRDATRHEQSGPCQSLAAADVSNTTQHNTTQHN